jgi:hypothetical protein
MAEVTYGFVNEENVLIAFAVAESGDTDTLNRLVSQFNAVNFHAMDLTKETTALNETFWNGTRFIHPSPFPSWVWSEEKNDWKAPIDGPLDGKYYEWNESTLNWIEVPPLI